MPVAVVRRQKNQGANPQPQHGIENSQVVLGEGAKKKEEKAKQK